MTLSSREKILAGAVVLAFFIVLNLVLFKAFAGKQATLREQLAMRRRDLASMQLLASERDLWAKRGEWLAQKQPKLSMSENSADVQLDQQISDIAKQHGVTLENKSFASPSRTPSYRSVAVNLETKCSWPSLIEFLHDVQGPEQFTVFENAEISIDTSDASQMRGRFRIARWYAPD